MAVVLDALVPYVNKMITGMAEEEVCMLLGVSSEIKKLEANLVYLQNYIADAERRRITDKSVKVWVGRLKDAMYEATDILELCQLEAMDRQPEERSRDAASNSSRFCSLLGKLKKKLQSFLEPFLFCLQNPSFAHEIGGRIKKLNGDLDGIRKDAVAFNFVSLTSYEEQGGWTDSANRSRISKTTPGFDETAIDGSESDFDQLKDVGMKIIAQCDGLPLAIKVMGGLLSTRRLSEREWEIVHTKNLEWGKYGSHEELNYSVHLSYDDLSPELKQCFLYYSFLPHGSAFSENIVISMWISEGFVQPGDRSESAQLDVEEIAVEYHRELVARNLLELNMLGKSGWVYTMHDVIRSFAQFVAREEALLVEETDIASILSHNRKIRRLSMDTSDSVLEWNLLEKMESLRTLVIDCNFKPGGGSSLASFSSLRVLDINNADCDWTLGIQGLENVSNGSVAARAIIGNKKHLTSLDLVCHKNDEGERIASVFCELCPQPYLEDLSMTGYSGRRLPNWMSMPTATAFKSLRCIELDGLYYCTQLPNGLCGMLSLDKLVINYAPAIKVVGPDFQTLASGESGGALVTRPFPKLRILDLHSMDGWMKWDWEEEEGRAMAMPALERLRITGCCLLTHLPTGLASKNSALWVSVQQQLGQLMPYG
uniref:Uncharacterized protein n=1 Tax=Avena sativa TaxID=4498 RepID=A0ACD5TGU3_AVESA